MKKVLHRNPVVCCTRAYRPQGRPLIKNGIKHQAKHQHKKEFQKRFKLYIKIGLFIFRKLLVNVMKKHFQKAIQMNRNDLKIYFHNFLMDIFFSESFCITLATAISKSSCVT